MPLIRARSLPDELVACGLWLVASESVPSTRASVCVMRPSYLLPATSFFVILVLASCARSSPTDLPTGSQTMTGVLLPAEISVIRRGTHQLKLPDGSSFFVESRGVNLRQYEGMTVGLHGNLVKNTDSSAAPVLVAEGITPVSPVSLRSVSIPSLGISIGVPSYWVMQTDQLSVRFTAHGALHPVLSLFIQPERELPFDMQSGKPIDRGSRLILMTLTVAAQRAIYVSSPSDAIESLHLRTNSIRSASGRTVLTLLYRPATAGTVHPDPLFMAIAHSLSFKAVTGSGSSFSSVRIDGLPSVVPPPPDGTQEGNPCGGTAGILCPQGEYCAVTDRESNVGRCRKL